MPAVKVKENEPFDVALRRFKRSCEKAGLLAEVRKREHYEKPTTIRKRAAAAAVKRHAKKMSRENRKRQRLYWFLVTRHDWPGRYDQGGNESRHESPR